jgi:hypothetical protein
MPITETTPSLSESVTAFSAAFIGLCRALEHQKILMPSAIAQEIYLHENELHDKTENKNVKNILEKITKKLKEPGTPVIPIS